MVRSTASQREKAAALLSLHRGGTLLILPNVWNPIGARILQAEGYPAVATASAAVSASLGYKDGERIKRGTMIDMIGRIARSVDVPVTADIEGGYGAITAELGDTVRAVVEAGAVGVNIEDGLEGDRGLRSTEDQCGRISAVREAAAACGLHLVINARIDTYLSGSSGNSREATEAAISRAAAYAKAGADCVYPIGPSDHETVGALRAGIALPINILASPKGASLPELESIGVNRVSFGPYVFRSCLRRFLDLAGALRNQKDLSGLADMLGKTETEKYLLDGPE